MIDLNIDDTGVSDALYALQRWRRAGSMATESTVDFIDEMVPLPSAFL